MEMQKKLMNRFNFQFRRLYNIKILSEVEQDILCETCSKELPVKTLENHELDSYLGFPEEDAELE